MAGSLNKAMLIGNLGADPEIRSFQNGGKVANLRIATSETWKDRQTGERKEKTEWHTVAIFSEGLVGVVERYLKKGSKVFIEGKLQTRKWQDAQGQDRYSTEIVIQGLGGTLTMRGGRLEAGLLGTVIEDATLDSRFAGSKLELTRLAGGVGRDGSIKGGGEIDLSAARSFPMDIRLTIDKAKMLDRDDFDGTGSGTLRIATDEYGGVVSGRLVADRATFRIGRASAADVPVLNVTERNVRVLGRPRFVYVPATRWLLDLEVRGDRRMFVSGMGIESEWRANLQVKGGAYTPELFGRVALVRGDYDFAGKRFQLTRGDVRFQGGYPPDPVIDIGAESSNAGFTAQLAINGTANRPAIAFSSVPALPQDEVLSRLLFGDSVTNLSAPEAVQLAGALATLQGGGGFNPINSVRKGLGIDRLRILPADQLAGRGTAVAAGQYIGRDVYVELATDAQGYTATNIEVSITRSLSILSQVATLGGTGAALRWQKDY